MRGTSVQEVKEVGGLHHAYPDSHTTMRTYPVLWDKSGLIAYTDPAKKMWEIIYFEMKPTLKIFGKHSAFSRFTQ